MKSIVSITLLCLLSVTQGQFEQNNKWTTLDITRGKRQNNPRDWRKNDNKPRSGSSQSRASSTTTVATTPNPCDPFVPPTAPDFSRGRRISEAKCLGYVWEMKVRQDNDTHEIGCEQHKAKLWGRRFVIGGKAASPGEFPHMGAVGWRAVKGKWIFKCGSSLISTKFVVTAAHCSRATRADTEIADPVPAIVRLGDKNIMDVEKDGIKPIDVKISKIIVHPYYASPVKYFDIALMELAEPVIFTKYVQPACLWGQFDTSKLGSQATVTGWGYINSARTTLTSELQVATLDFIDQKQCIKLLQSIRIRHFNGLQSHQMCAGILSGGVDACQGDSGGPLQVIISLPNATQGKLHYLVGVTSFGIGCARANVPGIYTRVASFIDWIESTVWGNV